jgi:hypothetical protein
LRREARLATSRRDTRNLRATSRARLLISSPDERNGKTSRYIVERGAPSRRLFRTDNAERSPEE